MTKKIECRASVTFVSFPNEGRRGEAYRRWVMLFLRARERELKSRPQKMAETGSDNFVAREDEKRRPA